MSFESLGLSKPLIDALAKAKFASPYPIQKQAIPVLLKRQDLIGIAPTGSGKTAAYVLPIVERLLKKEVIKSRKVRALIIVPTRELAIQVEEVIKSLSVFLPRNLKSLAVYGGVSISPQMQAIYGTEILVATPGRLLDLQSKSAVELGGVEIVVLDEADQVLSLGFKEELDQIIAKLPKHRQTVMFSATMGDKEENLVAQLSSDYEKLEIQKESITPAQITQIAYNVASEQKGPLLRFLIKSEDWNQVLVFTSSIRTADNLTQKLVKNGVDAVALHSKKSQGARTDALTKFKSGNVKVLVATDLAARGIDIKFLPYVVNYELPRSPTDYIHRIGRTGRAEMDGKAITFVTPDDSHHFKIIQKKMKRKVDMINADSLEIKG